LGGKFSAQKACSGAVEEYVDVKSLRQGSARKLELRDSLVGRKRLSLGKRGKKLTHIGGVHTNAKSMEVIKVIGLRCGSSARGMATPPSKCALESRGRSERAKIEQLEGLPGLLWGSENCNGGHAGDNIEKIKPAEGGGQKNDPDKAVSKLDQGLKTFQWD